MADVPVLEVADPQSANYSSRPSGARIQYFIVHAIAEILVFKDEQLTPLEWLTDKVPGRPRLSAHWLIYPEGRILELVSPVAKAWHVGTSEWEGVNDLNRFSVGAEFVVRDTVGWDSFVERIGDPEAFTPEQYWAGGWLVALQMKRRPISLNRVRGHSDVSGAEVRDDPKIDPGDGFEWRNLYGWTCDFLYRS